MADDLPGDVFDVVVVGAGLAGHAAALSAAERGSSVVLIEKGEHFGGSSARSGGGLLFAGTSLQRQLGVEDDPEAMRRDIFAAGKRVNDPLTVQAYIAHQLETYEWLLARGATFTLAAGSPGATPRLHAMVPADLVALLHHRLVETEGASYCSGAPARRLVRGSDGHVGAVLVETSGGRRHLTARRGVVLASGGFSRNSQLLDLFAPQWSEAVSIGGPDSDGDGLVMAWALGAQLADVAYIEATFGASVGIPGHFVHPALAPRLLFPNAAGAIVVNLHGRRFVNEDLNYKEISVLCRAEPQGVAIQVFDAQVMGRSTTTPAPRDFRQALADGVVVEAPSIDGLAGRLGLDSATLCETVAAYNSSVGTDKDAAFGRPFRHDDAGGSARIERPPFYGYPCGNALTTTYCGVKVDEQMRVVDVFGEPIEGLYAAGEVVGGFHGAGYVSGTGLGKAAVFGRAAGLSASA